MSWWPCRCARCSREFTGLVDRNGASVIARDHLAAMVGDLSPERVRVVCWQCSETLAGLSEVDRDALIRTLPHPGPLPA